MRTIAILMYHHEAIMQIRVIRPYIMFEAREFKINVSNNIRDQLMHC